MDKETSSRVSSIASEILNMEPRTVGDASQEHFNDILAKAKTLAGSALSQDQTPGQSGGIKGGHGIHPAPAEFSSADINSDPILHFFHYAHLPPTLQETSCAFFELAFRVIRTIPRNAERTVALRKLLEAKDAAVRANLPSPTFGQKELPMTSRPIGEPVETGGHDEDRDGPIPFGG